MGRSLPLTTLLVLAVFALTGGIIWLAYGETGNVDGEPPLIKASATPLKRAPDDPGGRPVADLGGVGELMADQPGETADERLMPTPEQPLSPAEAAVASLARAGLSDDLRPSPEKREQATAALKELVTGLKADGSGLGGPVSATTDRLPSPTRPGDLSASRISEKPLQRNEPEGLADAGIADNSAPSSTGLQTAAIGQSAAGGDTSGFEATPGGRFRVQLAAVRGENDAKRALSIFQQQFGEDIGNLKPFFERAENSNGIFYRVQVGTFADSSEASSLCGRIKKKNASCFVVRR